MRRRRCARLCSRLLGQLAEVAVGREWEMREAYAGRILQSVRDCRSDRIDRALALRLRPERPDRVICIGEEDLAARDVGKGRDAVVAKLRVHHGAVVVDHLLSERPAESHRDRTFYLAAALPWDV